MKNLYYIIILIFIGFSAFGQTKSQELKRDQSFYEATNKWFSAWKLVSEDIYKIDKVRPVDFVFYDDRYVYSTSNTTIKKGTPVKGCDLMNLKLQWKRVLHNDSLTLPDKKVIAVNLMSYAAESSTEGRPFFVMPLPSFWQQAGVSSKELGLENLVTGIFLHEFSHSQQMQNFGKKITEYEQQNNFGVGFNDDMVQYIFEKDTIYLNDFKKEIEYMYGSVKTNTLEKKRVKESLLLLKQRQKKYFKGEYINLKQIDNIFLTMEGAGEYTFFLWLQHPKGGNIKREIAIKGVRRDGIWWSQEQGFALFLILEKLIEPKNWAGDLFGDNTESIIDLVERLL